MTSAGRTITLLAVVMSQLLMSQQVLAVGDCRHAEIGAIGAIGAGHGQSTHAGAHVDASLHAGARAASAFEGHAGHVTDAGRPHDCRQCHCHCAHGTPCGQVAALLTDHRVAPPLAHPRSKNPSPHVPPTSLAHRWEPFRPPILQA